jgi:TonB family protein
MQSMMKFTLTPDLSTGGIGDGVAIQQRELTAEVFEEGEADENVTPVFKPSLSYPPRARELAIEGTVAVTFVVGVRGEVREIEEIDAPHESFMKEARKTISRWKFKPARNKGVPVNQRVKIAIDFSLDS